MHRLTSTKGRADVACIFGLILLRDLYRLYLDLLGTHRRFIPAQYSYETASRLPPSMQLISFTLESSIDVPMMRAAPRVD